MTGADLSARYWTDHLYIISDRNVLSRFENFFIIHGPYRLCKLAIQSIRVYIYICMAQDERDRGEDNAGLEKLGK